MKPIPTHSSNGDQPSAGDGRKAVFLDRDGVINRMVYNPDFGIVDSPANPDEFVLLPGVGPAVKQINQIGLLVIVISNQPGIAKGKISKDLFDKITHKMHCTLSEHEAYLDGVYYCLHHPEAIIEEFRQVCDCRKPKPGLIERAARESNIDLNASYFVGDGITDMAAGQTVGATCLFVGSRKEYILDEFYRKGVQPDYIVKDLVDAVSVICTLENGEGGLEPFVFPRVSGVA